MKLSRIEFKKLKELYQKGAGISLKQLAKILKSPDRVIQYLSKSDISLKARIKRYKARSL